jgi:hypothetical protein
VIFDLSIVTDTLTKLVRTAWDSAPLWSPPATSSFGINVTGLSPDAARLAGGDQLSLYLYHIDENNATESLFWSPRAQTAGGPPLKYQPMALDLYYLLSAFSQDNYVREQEAMSIAMRVFHENPIVRGVDAAGQPWEVTLTLERRSDDELSRLWQATTTALRVSAVYRAAVVLIEPEKPPPPAPPVSVVDLAVEPTAGARTPALLGTQREVRYTVPSGQTVDFVQDPATGAAGQDVWLVGTGLDTITTARLILTGPHPGNGQTDVSPWLLPPSQPPSAIRRTVRFPGVTGNPPAGAPAPGRYRLALEVTTARSASAFSTSDVPLTVAASVTPAVPPLLTGPPYVVAGTGFTANDTQVLLGTVALQPAAAGGAVGPGEFTINPAGTAITLLPPVALPSGMYQIRVRAAGIESDPALWLQVP